MTVGELNIGLSVDGADSAESATASLSDAIREMTLAVTSLAEEFTDFEGSLERAEVASEQASESIKDVGTASQSAAADQNEVQQELGQTAQAADRAADAQDQLSGSTGQATNIITGFGDATQDALVAGPSAAANNLTFIAEGFGEIVQSAGSVTGALRSVGAALLGPAGIILGVQLAISVLPSLIDALSDAGGASEQLSASLAALSGAVLPIQDELRELGDTAQDAIASAFDVTIIRNALGNVLTVITASLKTIGEVVELALNVITLDFDDAFGDVQEIVNTIFQAVVRVVARAVDNVLAALQTLASGVDSLFGTSLAGGAQAARQSVKGFFDGFTTDLAETERQVVNTATAIGQALGSIGSGGSAGEEDVPEVSRRQARPENAIIETEAPNLDQGLLDVAEVEGVQDALRAGLIQSVEDADAALQNLRTRFQKATSQEQRTRIQAVIRRVERLKKEFKGATRETTRFQQVGRKALSSVQSAFESVASGVGNIAAGLATGETQFKSFADVAKSALQSVISQLTSLAVKLAVIKPILGALSGGGGLVSAFTGTVSSGISGAGILSGGGGLQTGASTLRGGNIEIPVEQVSSASSIGSTNKARAGRL